MSRGDRVVRRGALFVVSATLFLPKDRKGIGRVPTSCSRSTTSRAPTSSSAILTAFAALLLLGVFYYLFRAVVAARRRGAALVLYLVYAAPLLFAIGAWWTRSTRVDAADEFTSGTRDPRGQAGGPRQGS